MISGRVELVRHQSEMSNAWCSALGITPPRLETVVGHADASTFALFLVALLERGEPMTLPEVAARLSSAGVGDETGVLQSLKRCRPGRPPVYRDGDQYHLDPHDDELDLWAFRLGLRPPRVRPAPQPQPESPIAGPDARLTASELDEAWHDQSLTAWSQQRLAIAVLDVLGRPGSSQEVVAEVSSRTRWHGLKEATPSFRRPGSAIEVLGDGRWATCTDADEAVRGARRAVRERIAMVRRYASNRPTAVALAEAQRAAEERRASHAAVLASLRRVVMVGFPAKTPRAVTLLDIGAHTLETYVGPELEAARKHLATYDVIAAMDVRALLAGLGIHPRDRRLAELGPPQKTMQIDRRGRTLKITTSMLIQSSCGISRPFGEPRALAHYLERDELTKLCRRLESDAKSLYALYEYGRLHGAVRVRWGFLDEAIPAPWAHRDEPGLHALKECALALGMPLEVVLGNAPSWADPWSRVELAFVRQAQSGWPRWLEDEHGDELDETYVQLARLAVAVH